MLVSVIGQYSKLYIKNSCLFGTDAHCMYTSVGKVHQKNFPMAYNMLGFSKKKMLMANVSLFTTVSVLYFMICLKQIFNNLVPFLKNLFDILRM